MVNVDPQVTLRFHGMPDVEKSRNTQKIWSKENFPIEPSSHSASSTEGEELKITCSENRGTSSLKFQC